MSVSLEGRIREVCKVVAERVHDIHVDNPDGQDILNRVLQRLEAVDFDSATTGAPLGRSSDTSSAWTFV
jgi:hypothetical protein